MQQWKYLQVSGLLMGFLLVAGGAGVAQEKTPIVPDAQIEANVLKALAGTSQLADQSISTTTVYGQVTLTGTVRDEASRDMAETVTSNAPGVKKVIDQLAIGTTANENGPGQDQNSAVEGPNSGPQPGAYPPNEQQSEDQQQGNMGDAGEPPNAGGPPNGGPQYGPAGPPPNAGPQPQYDPQYGPAGPPPQEGQNQPEGPYRRPYNPSYGQAPPPQYARPYPAQRGGEAVVVPGGTLLRVRVNEGMDSKNTAPGTVFDGIVINDVVAGNAVAIPRGTSVQGKVVEVHNAGSLKGKGELALQLTQITLGGQTYPIVSDAWSHQGADKTGQTVGNAVGLGAFGALIGAVAGGGPGALIGAGVGGAAGVGASAASGRGEAVVPAEAILNFRLTQQVPLTTVSQEEMNRLASGVQPAQQLRRRNPPPPPYYYYGPAYYPY
ncbi:MULTISPECIES: BON domain-containing protein [Acidobacteriaceae]|uniref:BON domain-containing protein n=1 Tax=Acidobacteriaceae TaxID=204434 RepID=UPI00131D71AC|nr:MULTISPECIES: BON domain-containing protein [Acidobacteriaceae]MDW5265178.1 BON domain-containing protein [Edaphobacter sp.]